MSESEMQSRIWCEIETGLVETANFCGGQLAFFSQRCPTRTSDPNEDSACFVQVASNAGVIAVADGVGGAAAGNRASHCIVGHLATACSSALLTEKHDSRGLRAEILDAIEAGNQEILKWGIGAGTTLSAVEFIDGWIRAYHVGDSGAMLISNRGKIKFATVGHAPIAQALEIGLIDEQEALTHEDRNLITNCLGSDTMKIEIGPTIQMAARDTLLIASDGLLDNLTAEEIALPVRKGDIAIQTQRLAEMALERMATKGHETNPSKPDDLTLICFRNFD
jgi:serine/threonine protein phosphatase PrpC